MRCVKQPIRSSSRKLGPIGHEVSSTLAEMQCFLKVWAFTRKPRHEVRDD